MLLNRSRLWALTRTGSPFPLHGLRQAPTRNKPLWDHNSSRSACHAQKIKKAEPSQAEKEEAAARAALPKVQTLHTQLTSQDSLSPQAAAQTLLLLGKCADAKEELEQEERQAAAQALVFISAFLMDRSEKTAETTTFANNLHPAWKMESTAPPRIQLLTSSELQKASWAMSKLERKLGLQEPALLQAILTQLAFDQE